MRSFNQCACSVHLLIMDAEEEVLMADFVAHVHTPKLNSSYAIEKHQFQPSA